MNELTSAIRPLLKSARSTAVAVRTLALSIGANVLPIIIASGTFR